MKRHSKAVLLVLAGLLALGSVSVPASASELSSPFVRPLVFSAPKSFGSEGSGPGQFGSGSPTSVAVDQSTGDVFALDPSNGRIEEFGPEGEFLSEFGSETPAGALEGGSRQLAVDNSTGPSKGDVYVTEASRETVEKFAPAPTIAEPNKYQWVGQLNVPEPRGIAVDSKGDVYVVHWYTGEVSRFGPAGEALGTITYSSSIDLSVAVAPNGDLYLVDTAETSDTFSVEKLEVNSSGEVESESVLNPGRPTSAVTVDSSGNVYVSEPGGAANSEIAEYNSSGELIEKFGTGQIGYSTGLAFSSLSSPGVSGHLYVADTERHEVNIFAQEAPEHPKPAVTECAVTTPTPVSAAASCIVNPNAVKGSWYVEYGEVSSGTFTKTAAQEITGGGRVEVELKSLTPLTKYRLRFVASNENGSSNGEEEVFKTNPAVSGVSGCSVTAIENEGATLNGSLEPLGAAPTSWRFQYGENDEYETAREESNGPAKQEPKVKITGLKPHHTYTCRLVAQDEYGTTIGESGGFTTTGPPILENQRFEKVGSVDAVVRAGLEHGGLEDKPVASKYYVEYAEASEYQKTGLYGLRTPETSVGEEQGNVAALATLNGLRAETEYHFRFVATDAFGTTHGPDMAFTTFSTIGSGLPDGRIYEMVSPPEYDNADVHVPREVEVTSGQGEDAAIQPIQASSDGNTVAFVADPAFGGNGTTGELDGNEYLASRTAEGWKVQNIMPSNRNVKYEAFSPDLSVGFIESKERLLPASPERPAEGYDVLFAHTLSDGVYHPLFTTIPPERPTNDFGMRPQEYGETEKGEPYYDQPVLYAGASADLDHVLFEANGKLTPEAADSGELHNNLYDSIDGRVVSVNVLPDGEPAPHATFGSYPPQPGQGGNGFHSNWPNLSHVISADGSRVFWTDLSTGSLYVRENDGTNEAGTVQVDASQAPAGEGAKEKAERAGRSGGGEFGTASSDGSKVFFTDCHQLTEDSTAVSSGSCEEIIECSSCTGEKSDYRVPTGHDLYEYDVTSGQLTDLTVDHDASDLLGGDVQGVIGASEDGEYVYFVADGDLAAGASSGQPNLYLSHGGVTTFIATLSPADEEEPEGAFTHDGDWQVSLGSRTAEVTPDGHSIVFESVDSLTGYDNNGFREVYVYETEPGRLVCASCLPTGEPPSGVSYLPGLVSSNLLTTHQPRWITSDGSRVFFNSKAVLVPHATNGAVDVYEWERDGSGSCQSARGCIYLLSGGTGRQGSYFLDASESGNDVFFATRESLVQKDGNEDYNIYDAHAGGVLPPSEPQCSGTGCQGVPLAPTAFEVPASVTFNGVGNFPQSSGPPAGKAPVKKHKKPKKTKKPKKHKKLTRGKGSRRVKQAKGSAERSGRAKRGRS